jgi:hypothetical protein
MFLSFLFLSCEESKPKIQSQKVDVALDPEAPGGIEVPLSELARIVPRVSTFSEEQQKRLWSALHLIQNPCSEKQESLLSSLQNKSCPASHLLLERALLNFSKSDDELLNVLTVPDLWFAEAKQGEEKVVVELWLESASATQELVMERLQHLSGARLRICEISTQKEKLSNQSLPIGQKVSMGLLLETADVKIEGACSSALVQAVRSSPTWFIEGFRLRGLQSAHSIQRLISLSNQDKTKSW